MFLNCVVIATQSSTTYKKIYRCGYISVVRFAVRTFAARPKDCPTVVNHTPLCGTPDLSFFAKGPPKTLCAQLAKFASRTNACRKQAEKIAKDLGLASFIRQE